MKKVLIIEDNLPLANLYRKRLSSSYLVEVVLSGDLAQDTAKSFNPNLILLDLKLPGDKNGYDILRGLKKDPQTQKIPVLILTSLKKDTLPAPPEEVIGFFEKSQTDLNTLEILVQKNIG